MQANEIIVRVTNDGFYLNPHLLIPIDQTNIPKEHLRFTDNADLYWMVEMLGFDSSQNSLKLKVSNYSSDEKNAFKKQVPKKPVKRLLFEKFDWALLEPQLYSYTKSRLLPILFNIDASLLTKGEAEQKPKTEEVPKFFEIKPSPMRRNPEVRSLRIGFSVYLKDVHFKLGYVTFSKRIKEVGEEVDFKIPNDHILPEFDLIKSWFSKILKTKKISVSAKLTFTGWKLTDVQARSEQIEQITPDLIDGVKHQRTLELMKVPRILTPDKSLFSTDELFDSFDADDTLGNVFRQSDDDILKLFMDMPNVRNKKQLAYLAGKMQSDKQKIRFTLNPNFGFLFFIEGEENNHFVWELLNSHATYVWSIDKSKSEIELQYRRIEDTISSIRANGRETYKHAYRNNHLDNDLVFRPINHEDASSNVVDPFPRWKSKLNEQLT